MPIFYYFVLPFTEELHKNLILDSKESETVQTKLMSTSLTLP